MKIKLKNNLKPTLVFLLFFSLECFSQENGLSSTRHEIVRNGVGLGSVIAVVISWHRNKSVLFAIIHGVFSWLYVIYYVIIREYED
jgi:hypothetical protein